MKIITRYLFKDIFHYFYLFVLIFVVILLVNKIHDMSEDIFSNSPKPLDVALMLIFGVPELLAQTLPLIGLMATIFAYGLLAKNREILAMVSVGISFRRLAVPPLAFGLGLTAFTFWFNEVVVPDSVSRAKYIEEVKIKKKRDTLFTRQNDLFLKGGENRFYFVKRYDSLKQEMTMPTLLTMNADGSGIAERIEAVRGQHAPDGKADDWQFTGVQHWRFNADGSLASYEKLDAPYTLKLEERLTEILDKPKEPEEMNYFELREYLDLMRQRGEKGLFSYHIALEQKLTFPISCLLMALLGYAVVADVNARRFAWGVLKGLLVAIGFYVLNALLKNLGVKGVLTPMLAGWLPVAAFAAVVWVVMHRQNKIRG